MHKYKDGWINKWYGNGILCKNPYWELNICIKTFIITKGIMLYFTEEKKNARNQNAFVFTSWDFDL